MGLGRLGNGAWGLAGETCAFDLIQAEFVRDIEPGEIVIIDSNGVRSMQAFPEHTRRAFCICYYDSLARPDYTTATRNGYKRRGEMVVLLAQAHRTQEASVGHVQVSGNENRVAWGQCSRIRCSGSEE